MPTYVFTVILRIYNSY